MLSIFLGYALWGVVWGLPITLLVRVTFGKLFGAKHLAPLLVAHAHCHRPSIRETVFRLVARGAGDAIIDREPLVEKQRPHRKDRFHQTRLQMRSYSPAACKLMNDSGFLEEIPQSRGFAL